MTTSPPGGTDRPREVTGRRKSIEYAVCADGSSPAREFVAGLSLADQAKILNLFRWLADHGEIKNGQKFKRLDGPIWEFKAHQIRIPCFQDGSAWVLTHGFIKKSDRAPRSEIDRAYRIQAEDLARKRPKASE